MEDTCSTVETVEIYYPPGVKQVIGFGSSSFIGLLENDAVLKYPHKHNDWIVIENEARVYEVLGSHRRILGCLGMDPDRGLLLEYAPGGSVRDSLRERNIPPRVRLEWARQAAEALSYAHTKGVIHCDFSTRNLLLNKDQELKLSDFIFALGSAIYEIMTGQEPYPELDDLDDEEEIEKRFVEGNFPDVDGLLGSAVILKCWKQLYDDATSCAKEIADLQQLGGS